MNWNWVYKWYQDSNWLDQHTYYANVKIYVDSIPMTEYYLNEPTWLSCKANWKYPYKALMKEIPSTLQRFKPKARPPNEGLYRQNCWMAPYASEQFQCCPTFWWIRNLPHILNLSLNMNKSQIKRVHVWVRLRCELVRERVTDAIEWFFSHMTSW